MSQYPSPYSPPTPYPYGYYQADPWAQLLRPARWAGALMIGLGAITLMCGGCAGLAGNLLPLSSFPPETLSALQQLETEAGISPRAVFTAMAILVAIPGLLLIVLGIIVRHGSAVAAWISTVLTSLILVVLALNIVNGLLEAARSPQLAGPALLSVVVVGIFAGACILLLVWLIRAIKASGQLRAARLQYQMQYWQYMQQQQMYAQGGYGSAGQAPQGAAMPPNAPSVPPPANPGGSPESGAQQP